MGSHRRLSSDAALTRRAALVTWAAHAVGDAEPAAITAAAATELARRLDLPLDDGAAPSLIRQWSTDAVRIEPPAGLVVDAWDLGTVHEATLDGVHRRTSGVHYTPRSVASGLAAIALDAAEGTTSVCDPAVGGGAFLLAAADILHRNGSSVDEVLGRLHGIDVDPLAVDVAGAALALWGAADGRWPGLSPRLVVADTLDPHGSRRADAGGEHQVDVVIGNPPFQSQLASDTARDPAVLAHLRRRWGAEAGPYCDTAAWFLLAALELAAPGGRIVLVLPQSLLGSADAAPIRARLAAAATITGLWIGDRGVFDADVRVCAPSLTVGSAVRRPDRVRVWSGPDVVAAAPVPATSESGRWSELLARAIGVPIVAVGDAVPLGAWCEATAGFRAQFYGLAPHTVDFALRDVDSMANRSRVPGEVPAGSAPLVTVGMIEPLQCRWGTGTSYRYAGRRWVAPAVDVAALDEADPTLARWVRDRLQPKVLVATQTKVVEAVVDLEGRLIPSTPVIAVTAAPERLGHLAAALTSPVATAAALAATAGSALSGETIKLSARQVLGLPTPVDHDAWDDGARLVEAVANGTVDRTHGLAELGRVMIAAAGDAVDDPDELFAWWWFRMRSD